MPGFQGSQLWQPCHQLLVSPFSLFLLTDLPFAEQRGHPQLSTSFAAVLFLRTPLLRLQVLPLSFQRSALHTSRPRSEVMGEAVEEDSSEQSLWLSVLQCPGTGISYFPLSRRAWLVTDVSEAPELFQLAFTCQCFLSEGRTWQMKISYCLTVLS